MDITDTHILAFALAEETVKRRVAEQENMVLKAELANLRGKPSNVTVLHPLPSNTDQSGEA